MKKIQTMFSIFLLIAMVLTACAPAATAVPTAPAATAVPKSTVKVALVLSGVITDNGWNAAAYKGIMAAKDKYGIEVAYSESVALPDFESTFRDYASKGFNLVIGHGSEFADVALAIGKEFPKTYFAVTNADVKAENVIGLDTKNEEAGYMGGFIAGLVSKSKIVGFVGGQEIVAMKRAELGFRKGVPAACPDCQIIVSWVGSVKDAAKGKETALAELDMGVDVLYAVADAAGLGVIQAAKEKNIMMIGNTGDQASLAPDQIITSTVRDLAPVVTQVVGEVVEGKIQPNTILLHGFNTGIYFLAKLNTNLLTPDQITRINAEVERMKKGEINLEHISAAK